MTGTSRTAPRTEYTRERALAELAAIWAELPGLACKGRCADTCTVTDGSALERTLLAERGKPLPPRMTLPEHQALIAAGRGPRCPALGPLGTCTVYDVRPLICRLFGLVGLAVQGGPVQRGAALACDYGCEPERWLTQEQGFALPRRVDEVSDRWEAAGRP